MCGKNIPDEEVNFDHIIPWSKGGSSDYNNIRLLCEKCNKKRSNSFEEEFLVASFSEIFNRPSQIIADMVFDLLDLVQLFYVIEKKFSAVSEKIFCEAVKGIDEETDKYMYMLVTDILSILKSETPFISVKKKMKLLKHRWGILDNNIYSINETCEKLHVDIQYYNEQETLLLRQIGFTISAEEQIKKAYLGYSTVSQEKI